MSDPTEPRDDSDIIEPCPFCGGAAEGHSHEGNAANIDDSMAGAHWIECMECGASTNLRYSIMDDCKPLLLEQWNRRAAPPPLSLPDTGNVGAETLSDAEVDLLLAELDQIARDHDGEYYGLPTWEDDRMQSMRAQVNWFFGRWVAAALPPPGRGMVPMTEEQKDKIYNDWRDKGDDASYDDLLTAVEEFHGIKEGS